MSKPITDTSKPVWYKFKQRQVWNDQQRIIGVAHMLASTPNISFKSRVEIVAKAKQMYEEAAINREGQLI